MEFQRAVQGDEAADSLRKMDPGFLMHDGSDCVVGFLCDNYLQNPMGPPRHGTVTQVSIWSIGKIREIN